MRIKGLLLLILFPIINNVFAQDLQNTRPSGFDSTSFVYSGAVGNEIKIPFRILYADDPGAIIKSVVKIVDGRPIPYDFGVKDLKKIESEDNSKGKSQDFEYIINPKEPGNYEITFQGLDKKRKDKFSVSEDKTVKLIVDYPVFRNITFPIEICEGEDIYLDFFAGGMTNTSDYQIVKSFRGAPPDTMRGITTLEMTKEKYNLAKGDAGQTLLVEVLYKGQLFNYYDDTTKEALSIAPKLSKFNVPVVDRRLNIKIPIKKFWYIDEPIEFTAKYCCDCAVDPENLKKQIIENPKITAKSANLFASFEERAPGKFAIYLKQDVDIPKDGVDVKVTIKARGKPTPSNMPLTIKLMKKKK
jgi:hypothetical protein